MTLSAVVGDDAGDNNDDADHTMLFRLSVNNELESQR